MLFDLNPKKREHILSAALRVFTNTPYEKASIQAIIQEAGIPRGSFYQYFTDKEDLYLYLLQITIEKAVQITYRDNMDFFWNMLYDEDPAARADAPWYNIFLVPYRQALTQEEYRFSIEVEHPANLLKASRINDINLLYPVFLHYIQEDRITGSKEDDQLLAFLFSTINLLSAEYGRLTDRSPLEAFTDTRRIFLAFYEAVRRKEALSVSLFSHTPSAIHLLSAKGVDLTAVPLPGAQWASKKEGALEILELPIVPGSLKGTFPFHAESLAFLSSSGTDPGNQKPSAVLTLELQEKTLSACRFSFQDVSHELGADLTLISVDSNGKRKVCIESGMVL